MVNYDTVETVWTFLHRNPFFFNLQGDQTRDSRGPESPHPSLNSTPLWITNSFFSQGLPLLMLWLECSFPKSYHLLLMRKPSLASSLAKRNPTNPTHMYVVFYPTELNVSRNGLFMLMVSSGFSSCLSAAVFVTVLGPYQVMDKYLLINE